MKLTFTALLISSTIVIVSVLTPISAFAADKIKAVATFSILGDMVSRVGGNLVEVITIVGPNSDTHVYEPKPADATALAGTKIFFVNGLGFEGWMERLVESTAFKGPTITTSDGIVSRTMIDDGVKKTDPHAWQNLSNGLVYVKNIAEGLCKVDVADCDTYKKNAEAYSAEITALDAEVKVKIASVPEAKRVVVSPQRHDRASSGTTDNPCGPLYSLCGRMMRLLSSCSMMCAHQPVMRLITKIGV